jgi:integrase/recombinase XerD
MPNGRSHVRRRKERESDVTVKEAVLTFLASPEVKAIRRKTLDDYRSVLLAFAEWCEEQSMTRENGAEKAVRARSHHNPIRLHRVDASVVYAFLSHVEAHHRPSRHSAERISTHTLADYVKIIKRFLNWCVLDEQYSEHVKAITVQRIRKPPVEDVIKRPFSDEELQALFAACDREMSAHLAMRDRAILAVLLDSGLRANELVTLTIGNIYLSPKDAYVRVLGKGRKWGEVGLGETARRAVQRYIRQFRLPTIEAEMAVRTGEMPRRQEATMKREEVQAARVFVNRAGQPLTTQGLYQIIRRLGRFAGVPNAHPHRFRHTFAVLFWRRTHDVLTLSKLLRHSSVSVTEHYLKSIQQSEARRGAPSVLDEL